ncbi:hypothetical protein DQ04_09841020 [Trypanosoma grayi]|uniref:hypothetical protein n=1 Tax=Trypanosoma grayi TaxID=71804 RepID=UPI0004F48F5A|nr:hypothetical protein DQ04_09841020 [Trypanosoma grayi]KEG07428.1 hypothetical protein DQ04_09841020 [Trypanosoma grayi]
MRCNGVRVPGPCGVEVRVRVAVLVRFSGVVTVDVVVAPVAAFGRFAAGGRAVSGDAILDLCPVPARDDTGGARALSGAPLLVCLSVSDVRIVGFLAKRGLVVPMSRRFARFSVVRPRAVRAVVWCVVPRPPLIEFATPLLPTEVSAAGRGVVCPMGMAGRVICPREVFSRALRSLLLSIIPLGRLMRSDELEHMLPFLLAPLVAMARLLLVAMVRRCDTELLAGVMRSCGGGLQKVFLVTDSGDAANTFPAAFRGVVGLGEEAHVDPRPPPRAPNSTTSITMFLASPTDVLRRSGTTCRSTAYCCCCCCSCSTGSCSSKNCEKDGKRGAGLSERGADTLGAGDSWVSLRRGNSVRSTSQFPASLRRNLFAIFSSVAWSWDINKA